jgi:hypothetical protein
MEKLMNEVLLITLGWLFGLLSPRMIDSIKSYYEKIDFLKGIVAEAKDLQYRLALGSYTIAQKEGLLTREKLIWFKSVLLSYQGSEFKDPILLLINTVLNSENDSELKALNSFGNETQKAISLKNYSASFLSSNIEKLHTLPISFQVLVHEFLNVLSILNQEIVIATKYHGMSFESSISPANYILVVQNLHESYLNISTQGQRASEKLQKIIDYKL